MLDVLSYFGTAIFAVSGALRAGEHKMDLFGVLVVAAVTAIGGGTLRDLLLDQPVAWVDEPGQLVAALGAGLATFLLARRRPLPTNTRLFLVADAIGLATFAAVGSQIADLAGASIVAVVVIATINAVAGGVIRDILCADVPLVLREQIYASAAVVGSFVYLGVVEVGATRSTALVVCGVLVLVLRLASLRAGVELPTMQRPPPPGWD